MFAFDGQSHSRKRKILKWIEDVFVRVSGEDQLLQLDEFTTALNTDGVSVDTVHQSIRDCMHVCMITGRIYCLCTYSQVYIGILYNW